MAALGANVVRVHLQVGKFLRGPKEPDRDALDRLGRLVALAERCRLYLDLTGLGCYHKADVPAWYDALSEDDRWSAQACFWEAIAERCAGSSAIFCYDLMNEPIVPGGKRKPGDWLAPPFAGKCFVQFLTLDQADRPREEIARRWIKRLSGAIREHDRRHLITVGLLPWDPKWGHLSGFVPATVAPELDYLSVHIYPEKGEVDEALTILKKFAAGKPVVIEETFPLKCSGEEYRRFLEESREHASGWISFYWGKTREEYRRSGQLGDALIDAALGSFMDEKDRLVRP
jgi:Cellulase (glycosyl hydrolase family 5)